MQRGLPDDVRRRQNDDNDRARAASYCLAARNDDDDSDARRRAASDAWEGRMAVGGLRRQWRARPAAVGEYAYVRPGPGLATY